MALSGCSKGKPIESASLATNESSYSYVIYENGKIESKNKNDYEQIQSQKDFIDLACITAEFIGSRGRVSGNKNRGKITTKLDSMINLLDFVNNPLPLGLENIEISHKDKNIKLIEAKEKLSKVKEIPLLKYQITFHSFSESGDLETTSNERVIVQNGKVACYKDMLETRKN